MNRKEMREILDLCLDINEFTSRAAFFELSGHCDMLDVRVCVGKERGRNKDTPNYSNRIYEVTFLTDSNVGPDFAADLKSLYDRELKRERLMRELEGLDL